MKITKIEPVLAGGRYLFIYVHTDEGITGLGECGAWGFQEATVGALKIMEDMILGLDPFQIEHIWNGISRSQHFRGSVLQAALSGIDIALWDIKGKALGVPIYELLGGKTRDLIRIYANVGLGTAGELSKKAKALVGEGHNALRFSITHPTDENGRAFEPFSKLVGRIEDTMSGLRDAVGWDVDIAIEVHRGLRPAEAIEIGRVTEKYRPYFYEDPIPDNIEAMKTVIDECRIPVATGERFIDIREFDSLMTHTRVRYIRPDMCLAGGITAGKKIAAMAEAKGVYVIPHNPLGPVSTAACLQLNACIPNFEVQEYPMFGGKCRLDAEMKKPFEIESGFIKMPTGPGLGIELIDDIGTVFPFQGMHGKFSYHKDGSMVDR